MLLRMRATYPFSDISSSTSYLVFSYKDTNKQRNFFTAETIEKTIVRVMIFEMTRRTIVTKENQRQHHCNIILYSCHIPRPITAPCAL